MATPLIPPIDDAHLPPLHTLEWQKFEQLTVDLFQYEDGISDSEQHGTPGPQTDYGVDVIAWRRVDSGIEVASCKRYPTTSAAQLAGWSKEFLDHWAARWSGMSVRRFVLATTATNLASIAIINQVADERRRFSALGIAYELWGPRQFVKRLRPHRQLTAAYLTETWADTICGVVSRPEATVARSSSPLNEALVSTLAELQTQLSGSVSKRADAALDALRAGQTGTVHALMVELREPSIWQRLAPGVQATVLRLAGSSALQEQDLEQAQRYDAEATALSPMDEPRLSARITLAGSGPAAALDVIGEPVSIPGRQLRAALLLGNGDREEARELLDRLLAEAPNEGETLRLDALERLGRNDRDGALAAIACAERSFGHWIAIMRAGAIIRYAMAMSPSVGPPFLLQPNPVLSALVREDEAAQDHLERSLALLDRIEQCGASVDEDRIWRVAVLANLKGRRADASSAARDVMAQDPGEPTTFAWVLQRDLDVDPGPSIQALEQAYTQGAELPQVRVLGLAYASTGRAAEGASFLEKHAAAQSGDAAGEAAEWTSRLRNRSIDADSEALRRAQQDGDWSDAQPLLDRLLSATPPEPFGLVVAELAASAGRWDLLRPHLDALTTYGTATGVRLAALAASAAIEHGRVIAILDANTQAFGGDLSRDLLRRAVSLGVRPEHELAAMDQALQLGLDREASVLMPRVHARAEGGATDIRILTMEEVREMILGHQQDEDHVRKLYLEGAIPVHLAVRGRPDALLRMQQANASNGRGHDARLQPRLTRHGARPRVLEQPHPWPEWSIHLDVTGLLEAERFGLLTRMEGHPNGITISPHLPEVLRQMRDGVAVPQPRRTAAMRRIASLIDENVIGTVFPPGVEVQAITDPPEADGGEGGRARVHTAIDLVAVLTTAGLITAAEASALGAAGGAVLMRSAHAIDLSKPVLIPLTLLERLAAADVLERVAREVPTLATRRDVNACRLAIASSTDAERLVQLAGDLAQRVGDGIENGTYRLLPPAGEEDEIPEVSALDLQLADLLRAPAVAGGVVWFDDRNLNGYVQTGTLPIVGTVEAIHALQRADIIDQFEADRLLIEMRASGAACLPFDAEEIMAPLLAAPVTKSGIVETPALASLRRSFAMTASLEPHLKIGLAPELLVDRPDEDQIVRSTMRIFGDALERLWLQAASRMIAIVDAGKQVARLGRTIPIEVLPFARGFVSHRVEALGGVAVPREGGPAARSDQGYPVLDCRFPAIDNPERLAAALASIPGLLAHGLFLHEIDVAYVGRRDGVERIDRPG